MVQVSQVARTIRKRFTHRSLLGYSTIEIIYFNLKLIISNPLKAINIHFERVSS